MSDFALLDPALPLDRLRLLAGACVRTDPLRCVQCGLCNYNCPLGLDVRGHARRGSSILEPRCLACGECVRRCPREALGFGARSARQEAP
ncbi:MAG: 4Fe-4S binding protein [Polyangiaceae bacterium]|nr:4Fe-4S binding protein [Polyangiaceae bacterium]